MNNRGFLGTPCGDGKSFIEANFVRVPAGYTCGNMETYYELSSMKWINYLLLLKFNVVAVARNAVANNQKYSVSFATILERLQANNFPRLFGNNCFK